MTRVVTTIASILLTLSISQPAFAQCSTMHSGNPSFTGWGGGYTAAPMTEATAPTSNPFDLQYPGMGVVPTYNNYLTNTYSRAAFSNPTIAALIAGLCGNVGQHVHFVNYVDQTNPAVWATWSGIRVIHGIQYNNNFFTLILPSSWTWPSSPNRHPVIVHSGYDVNEDMFSMLPGGALTNGQRVAYMVARSTSTVGPGSAGAVGLLWNGGGSATSMTVHPDARTDFDGFLNYMAANQMGTKASSVYMFGRSRGATAALMMASNPAPRASGYIVKYVTAIAPGVLFGDHVDQISATMPRQLNLLGYATGYAKAWIPGWLYPGNLWGAPNPPAKDATRFNFTGDASIPGANSRSPAAPAFLSQLASDGVRINISVGSHDEYIPHGHQVDYIRELQNRGIQYIARVVLGGGHLLENFGYSVGGEINCLPTGCGELEDAVRWELGGLGAPTMWNDTAIYSINTSTDALGWVGWASALNAWNNVANFPATVQLPTRIMPGMEGNVFITGPYNAQVDIFFSINGGTPFKLVHPNGAQPVIPSNSNHLEVKFNTTVFTPGQYLWITSAAVGGVPLNINRPTTCGANNAWQAHVYIDSPNFTMTGATAASFFSHAFTCGYMPEKGYGLHRYPQW